MYVSSLQNTNIKYKHTNIKYKVSNRIDRGRISKTPTAKIPKRLQSLKK